MQRNLRASTTPHPLEPIYNPFPHHTNSKSVVPNPRCGSMLTHNVAMPLFGSNSSEADKKAQDNKSVQRKSSVFSSSKSTTSDNTSGSSGSFFARHSIMADKDPSIVAARQKVTDAESAEKAADRALDQARSSVKEAREHVKKLEKEAIEE